MENREKTYVKISGLVVQNDEISALERYTDLFNVISGVIVPMFTTTEVLYILDSSY